MEGGGYCSPKQGAVRQAAFLFLWSSGRALVVVTGLLLEILPTIPSSESKKRKKGGFHPKPGMD
jgi:hypothetical protein